MTYEYQDLRERTKMFAVSIIRLYASLPKSTEAQVIGKQMLRSGTSVGANYHEATRSRTAEEFVSKLHISLQELEETRYWLDLLIAANIVKSAELATIQDEAYQLVAILVTVIKRKKSTIRENGMYYDFENSDF